MIRSLILLNLINVLDGVVTLFGCSIFGTHIEANPFLRENLVMGILLIKIPVVLLVSWVAWEYNKRTEVEQIFLERMVIIMGLLLCAVVLFNCYLMLSWI